MIICNRWDVALVPFPFTDLSSTKRRPALVVSPDNYNVEKDVVILFITSQINVSPRVGDYDLQKWREAGLPKPSKIRMKFATIDKSLIIKKLGKLKIIDQFEIQKTILSFFGS